MSAVAAGFSIGLGLSYERTIDEYSAYKTNLQSLQLIKNALLNYNKAFGSFPDNNAGLNLLTNMKTRTATLKTENLYSYSGLAFIYENRTGMNADKFRGSPANDDSGEHYSINIDKLVFVSSVDGKAIYRRMSPELPWMFLCFGSGLLFLLITIALKLRMNKSANKSERVWPQTILLMLFTAIVGWQGQPTCYISSPLNKSGKYFVPEQIQLLEKYRRNGIINDATYDKLQKTTDRPN
jgi:hypothetical protein